MTSRRLFLGLLGLLMLGSFSAGLLEPELRAQGGLPELLTLLRPSGNGRELEPLNTHKRVLELVKERFYGDTPSEMRLTYAAIRGLLNRLDDPYTRFLDPEEYADMRLRNQGEFEGIGAELSQQITRQGYVRIDRPIPGGPAERAGLRSGDLILRINGRSVVGRTVDEVVAAIRGKAGTSVRLTVQSGKKRPRDVVLVRQPVELEVVESRLLNPGIGYVSLAEFNEIADQKLERAIRTLERQGMRGLILDLRGNPGGLLDAAVEVASRFIPPRKDVVVIVEPNQDPERRQTIAKNYLAGKWPLVVLVNRTSASASEIVAGAIQDNQVGTLIGTTTFGKGLVQTLIPLEGGSACAITTQKYLTPSGRDINRTRDQRGGVNPDLAVEITEEEFLSRTDRQLKRAVEYLEQKLGLRKPTDERNRNQRSAAALSPPQAASKGCDSHFG
ncbi:MAG: S41 family peptidase [Armatimonadetes bacterium]|nr:S41 family peptidase [Armatimonadota bacterium]